MYDMDIYQQQQFDMVIQFVPLVNGPSYMMHIVLLYMGILVMITS
jgi:hypothetical protein